MSIEGSELTGMGSVKTGAGQARAGTPGGPFPGFGGAPPAIAGASAPGSSGLASESDHTHAGVHKFNGVLGDVGYAPVIPVASLVALAAVPTLGSLAAGGLGNGQTAFILVSGRMYVLQAAITAVADGKYVIATFDDPTRQWVLLPLTSGAALTFELDAEVDLKVPQQLTFVPALPYRLRQTVALGWVITASVAPTVAPTYSAGTNAASFNNYCASQTPAGFTSQAVGTIVFSSAVNPAPAADITSAAFKINITGGATATTLKARPFMLAQLLTV